MNWEKESRTAWKEARRGGDRVSTRLESKCLEIRGHGKEKQKSKQGEAELKTKTNQSKRNRLVHK